MLIECAHIEASLGNMLVTDIVWIGNGTTAAATFPCVCLSLSHKRVFLSS